LKRGITAKDLTELKSEMLKKVAAELLDGTYDKAHRAASYEAYPSPRQLGETLKLGDGFSRYENITGIHLNEGEIRSGHWLFQRPSRKKQFLSNDTHYENNACSFRCLDHCHFDLPPSCGSRTGSFARRHTLPRIPAASGSGPGQFDRRTA
jgi:hypothetical protein